MTRLDWLRNAVREHLAKYGHLPKKKQPCLIWPWGNGTYGTLSNKSLRRGISKTPAKAHRISYREFVGEFPDELFICHHCDNPPCFNPSHLFPGTNLDNIADMVQKGRHKVKRNYATGEDHGSHTHPEQWAKGIKHGQHTHPEKYPKGESMYNAALSNEQAKKVLSMLSKGFSRKALAQKFSVSTSVISSLVLGRTYNEATGIPKRNYPK